MSTPGPPDSQHLGPSPAAARVAIILTAAVLLLPVLLGALSALPQSFDFAAFYTSALVEAQGNSAKLYDLGERALIQTKFLHGKGMLINPYPPFQAVLFVPLTWLGFRSAYLTWGVINVLMWLVFQHLLRHHAGREIRFFPYMMLCSLFLPLWMALLQGQFSILLLLSFTLALLLLERSKDGAAGFASGLGLLKFQVLAPFALIFFIRRKWRFIAGIGVAACLATLISLDAGGPTGLVRYGTLLVNFVSHPSNPAYAVMNPRNMCTVRGLVVGLLSTHMESRWIGVVSAALSSWLILFVARSWHRISAEHSESTGDRLMFAASLAASLVTAPHLYAHDLTPLLLAIVLVISSPQWNCKSRARHVLVFLIGVLYASPLYLVELMRRQMVYLLAPVLVAFVLATVHLARWSRATANGGQSLLLKQ